MDRAPGLSVRLKLTLSYAAFLVLAGALLLALWVVLMRIFPHAPFIRATRSGIGGAFVPGRSPAQQAFGQAGVAVLAFLLVFGLAGGWILAGRMLAPLTRITDATRMAANGRMRGDHAGVGLGLAIVKSITQAHDGTLTLSPRAAGGLCVTAELPVAAPHTGR